MRRGRFEEAAKCYERIVERFDGHCGWWLWLGEAQAALGQDEKALRSFRNATSVIAVRVDAFRSLAMVHRSRGRYRLALRYALRALAIDPANHAAKELRRDLERVLDS